MSIKNIIKKYAVAGIIGAAFLGAGSVALAMQMVNNHQATPIIAPQGTQISAEQAKQIAEEHTGVKGLTFDYLELEYDDHYHNPHYEVDAYKDGVLYDLDIDTVTGEVLTYSTEGNTSTRQTTPNPATTPSSDTTLTQANQPQETNGLIDEAKVKEIAAKATGKNDLTFASIHLETDDGYDIYDVKATSGNIKYDLDIDAVTGDVLQSEQESIATTRNGDGVAKLSENDIRNIAGKTTGKNNLTFTKIHLSQEWDDYAGALIYEVTAYADGVEYELDIDANDGRVLSSSAEQEDDWFD